MLIDPTAKIHPSALIGPNVTIGPNVVVGEGARIKDQCCWPTPKSKTTPGSNLPLLVGTPELESGLEPKVLPSWVTTSK